MTTRILRLLMIVALLSVAHGYARAHGNDGAHVHSGNILGIHDGVAIEILKDAERSLSLSDIREYEVDDQFTPFTQNSFNFGLVNADIWLKITLEEPVTSEVEYIEVANPYIDEVTAYVPSTGGDYTVQVAGDSLPFADRAYPSRTFIFYLADNAAAPTTFYLHFRTAGNLHFLLNLWSDDGLQQYLSSSHALLGLYFGLLLIVSIYSSVMCLRLKEAAYCYYMLYMAAVMYFMLAMYGTGYQYFWTDFTYFAKTSAAAGTGIFILAGMLFCRVFLHTKKLVPALDRLLLFLMGLASMQIVISYMGAIKLAATLAAMQAIVTPVVIWLTVLVCWKKGYRPARYLAVAWTVLVVAIVVSGLTNLGLLPANPVTLYALLAGSAMEVVLISLALSDRLAILKQEKDLLKSAYLNRLENTTAELERMVADRTSELTRMTSRAEDKAEELERTNKELKELTNRDSMTGLINHQAFFTYLEHAIKSAHRYEYYLSILLIDIDDFKSINDTHGHLVGNEVIKAVANVMQGEIRESDIAARFGGEEFIIVLSHATMTEALEKAEKIRTRVEQITISSAEELQCTISTGITTVDWHKSDISMNEVIRVADNAMYEAKSMGKNRIKVAEINYQVVNK